jgi:hypothetical protein
MFDRGMIGSIALSAALLLTLSSAQAFDESKYPDLTGQWRRTATGQTRYDPSKPAAAQQAPLKEEYKAIHAASIANQNAGGQGLDTAYRCIPMGMPRQMSGTFPFEILVRSDVTHILFELVIYSTRRIHTDGRDWPKDEDPTFAGYSIGKWRDENGDGRYDVLELETRHIKGPRAYDASGLPLHRDNQTVVKERIYVDHTNPNILHDQITVIDNALTRPWMVTKNYRRNPNPRPNWQEYICAENNNHVHIGKESYFLSADGYLMPAKKGQPPPDLRYFNQARK